MKVLIIGSGAREHAIVKQIAQSKKVTHIYCAPGNAGMEEQCECIPLPAQNVDLLLQCALKNKVDLTIVGPEVPLAMGIVDTFENAHLKIFGPTKKASILEVSKVFTKEFCERHNIPTAPFKVFEDSAEAKSYVENAEHYPLVLKVDGLAAGKGVIIAQNQHEAKQAITEMMLYEKFGSAGRKIIIEDFVSGHEASFIIVTDGTSFVEFPSSQDHKRLLNNDQGPNTGGMGAYAPAPLITPELSQKVIDQIIQPTLRGMQKEDRPYKGFLYAGLMVTPNHEPLLLEYNCRLGDPETEVILPLLKSDFVEMIELALDNNLHQYKAEFEKQSAACVVLAGRGYPESSEKGAKISGLDRIVDPQVFVYHAGTKRQNEHFMTDGGRVLVVSAKAPTLAGALEKVYANVAHIDWPGMQYRTDIGSKATQR